MSEPSLSASVSLLLPFARSVFQHARRLHVERQAGQAPLPRSTPIMDDLLSETLDRVRGGSIDSGWWRSLLDRFGQQYVAPDFLRKPALLEWFRDDSVAEDLKTIATWRIMAIARDEAPPRDRLAQSYSNRTGEPHHFAAGPIDVVVAILVAGYSEAMPDDQRAIAAMVQTASLQIDNRFDLLEKSISPVTDPITGQAHTKHAAEDLTRILTLRAFDPTAARAAIQKLQHGIESGNLSAVDDETRRKIRYWLARLCAGDVEKLDIAKKCRARIRNSDPGADLTIVDALIRSKEGDPKAAIRLLRDRDDPDSRTVLFALLAESQGADTA